MARTVISYKWGYSCKSHTLTIMLEIHGVYCSDGRSTIMQKIIVYVAILPDGRVVLLHRYAVNIILILALMMLHTNAMSQYNRVHIGVMCVNLHSNLFSFWFCFFFFFALIKWRLWSFLCLLLYLEIFIDLYMELFDFPSVILTLWVRFRKRTRCFCQRLERAR